MARFMPGLVRKPGNPQRSTSMPGNKSNLGQFLLHLPCCALAKVQLRIMCNIQYIVHHISCSMTLRTSSREPQLYGVHFVLTDISGAGTVVSTSCPPVARGPYQQNQPNRKTGQLQKEVPEIRLQQGEMCSTIEKGAAAKTLPVAGFDCKRHR